jgi:hypothetical protein
MEREPGRCVLCNCTEHLPCRGGTVFASAFEANFTHRLVADAQTLAPGMTCSWIEGLPFDVCSAHSDEEIAAALALEEQELPRMVAL